jgi:hypothetical protein
MRSKDLTGRKVAANQMIPAQVIWAALGEVMRDRTVSLGGLFSTISIFTGLTVDQVHKWVALYAVGAAGATVSLIIGCVKLWRILRAAR